ncbi:hypothetical protein Y032_0643g1059 [Ancylostoma ceylanicum]|uniref:Uncharacterized protein n=1 Tax=Ancylostoma ceylanicum TaxID=53326 RepID=A0A016WIR9_9BILA|nr:hypothetical protein Y032_0643g1059 [Ancylostoma ceylanicum]
MARPGENLAYPGFLCLRVHTRYVAHISHLRARRELYRNIWDQTFEGYGSRRKTRSISQKVLVCIIDKVG